MIELLPIIMFLAVCLVLMLGYPVALSLAGVGILFASGGIITGVFDPSYLNALPNRLFGTINNSTLMAVPLFVLMGLLLEKSKLAEEMLNAMGELLSNIRGGMALAVVLVGMLLAASTGIVGATVVTMGLMSLPSMLKRGYDPQISTGVICATGTLGQIIPPSIALVLLGDILSNAYQQAQLKMGVFNPDTISVGDLFIGAIIPGLLLVFLYAAYIIAYGKFKPQAFPEPHKERSHSVPHLLAKLLPAILLMATVLGSILFGIATPTEAAGIGALGAALLALLKKQLSFSTLQIVAQDGLKITCMIFLILIGAAVFSLVFRGFGGEELIHHALEQLPGGKFGALFAVMLLIFLLGFILDFIEITFVVVPIVGPILLMMGIDPLWLGILIAINLQTSFLTPPFGFALFYLRGVAPASIKTQHIYKGVIPFIVLQLIVLACLVTWPELVTYLPEKVKAMH